MPGTILTSEARQASQEARREGRKRLAEEATAAVNALLADAGPVPEWAQRHAAKARKGNTRSLIALKCGDCSCWQRAEIALCTVTTCPLFPLRPYKARDGEDAAGREGQAGAPWRHTALYRRGMRLPASGAKFQRDAGRTSGGGCAFPSAQSAFAWSDAMSSRKQYAADLAELAGFQAGAAQLSIGRTIERLQRLSALLVRPGPAARAGLVGELTLACTRIDAACDFAERLAGLDQPAQAPAEELAAVASPSPSGA